MRKLLIPAIVLASSMIALALPGDLDTTFGVTGGYLISDFASSQLNERHRDAAIQSDGKLVVVGSRERANLFSDDYLVARYNADGTLDTTFGTGGFFTLFDGLVDDSANAVAILPDGKIIVAGGAGESSTSAYVFRLDPDGTLDTTFSGDGIQTVAGPGVAVSMAIQTDGKIVLATNSDGSPFPVSYQTNIVRLNSDGTFDSSFDGDGRKLISSISGVTVYLPYGLAIQTDGKIVAAGRNTTNVTSHDVSLIRLNTDGSFDTTFDGDGVVHTALANQEGEGHSVIIGSDGKITVGGAVTQIGTVFYDAAILRYNPNGSLDVSFDGDGIKMVEFVANNENYRFREIVQQPDGKYVAIAEYRIFYTFFTKNDFFVTRLNEDGSSDDSFDANSIVKSQWCEDGSELVLQPDGKIVAIGSQTRPGIAGSVHGICVQRFNSDGSVDHSFNAGTPNGKSVLGQYDLTTVNAVAGLSNGKILVAGWGTSDFGFDEARLIRLNADGTLDTTFMDEGIYRRTSTTANTYFYDLRVLGDGSFLIAGEFGGNGAIIMKFSSAGVPDTTFSGDGMANTTNASRFHAVAVQSDGKLIGCGSAGATTRSGRVARFSASGTYEAFSANNLGTTGSNNEILECGIQSDGKIVVAGYGYNSIQANDFVAVSRHLTTLSVDSSFGTSGVVTTDMSPTLNDRATDMVVQPDDKIVVSSTGFGLNGDRDFAVIRYESNGTLDTNFTESFGSNGLSLVDFLLSNPNDEANALLLEPAGQFVVGGVSNNGTGDRFALAKLNATGTIRLTWGTLGRSLTSFPNSDARITALGLYADGKVLAAGRTWNGTDYDFAIAKYQNELAPTAATVSVAGRVVTADGSGIRNALITLTAADGTMRTARTSSFGYFEFGEVQVGETIVLSISSKRYRFEPSSQLVTVNDNIGDIQFVAQK